jgi:hypothetical protein
MKNRDPEHWRDRQQLEHVLGKYLISDQPVTEEEWARERATVIDDEPVITSSYSTTCPSLRLLRPALSTAEMWTKTSLVPPCG